MCVVMKIPQDTLALELPVADYAHRAAPARTVGSNPPYSAAPSSV